MTLPCQGSLSGLLLTEAAALARRCDAPMYQSSGHVAVLSQTADAVKSQFPAMSHAHLSVGKCLPFAKREIGDRGLTNQATSVMLHEELQVFWASCDVAFA
eukprot:NODE_22823_length_693_cov_1.298587.p2 GENE.NODE_22823_length_693_cov_1.298587~~NODE_22823_length_693_cov_1.298587.p2  ORF type:complete len:101 (-),score=12.30 NODE_22823_length_693_cov_1.298587:276-578(-)